MDRFSAQFSRLLRPRTDSPALRCATFEFPSLLQLRPCIEGEWINNALENHLEMTTADVCPCKAGAAEALRDSVISPTTFHTQTLQPNRPLLFKVNIH
jgi:hypothetical protein